MTRTIRLIIVATLFVSFTAAVHGQGNQPAPVQQAAHGGALVPLKVTLVLAQYQGEKKISSVPYMLFVIANVGDRTSLRVGNDVPVASTVVGPGGDATKSFSYRTIGTNIDCMAQTGSDGLYRVTLTVTDSSVAYPKAGEPAQQPMAPTFRAFNSTFNILVRDGQTVQYTSAADPVSGHVVKLDATVNVQK